MIYEHSSNEYKVTSAEFTEELKTIQRILENHIDERVVLVGTSEELNIDDLYQKEDKPRRSNADTGITEGESMRSWLSPDLNSKIEVLYEKYSKYDEGRKNNFGH